LTTKRLAIRGVIFNWFTFVCQIAIVFVTTPILVRELDMDGYGIWTIVMSFTAWYVLADFGLRGATVKFISQYEAEEDYDSINHVIVTTIGTYLVFSCVLMCVASVIAWRFPHFFDTAQQDPTTIRWVVMLSAAAVAINLLGQIFDAVLVAHKRFDLSNLGNLSTQVLQAALMVTALLSGEGLFAMAIIVVFVACVNQLYRYIMARRILPQISLNPKNFDKPMLKQLVHFGGLSAISVMARQGSMPLSNLLVGKILGVTLVPFFSIAGQLAEYGARLATGVAGPLMPVASQLNTLGREKILRRAFTLGTKTLLAMGCIMGIVLVSVGTPLLEHWMPSDLKQSGGLGNAASFALQSYPILCVLVPAYILRMIGMGSRSILMGTHRVKYLGMVGIIDITISMSVGITLLLIWRRPVGMAWGLLIGQIVTGGCLMPVAAARAVGVTLGQFIVQIFWPAFRSILPVALVGYAVWYGNKHTEAYAAASTWQVVLQALGIGLVGALSMFLLAFDQSLRNDILAAFISKKFLNAPLGQFLMKLPVGKQLLVPLLTHTGRGKVPPEESHAEATDDKSTATTEPATTEPAADRGT